MKYIKLIFSFVILISFFSIIQNIYATEQSEDLTLSRIYVEPGTLDPEFSETRDYYTLILNKNTTNLIVQATPTNEELHYEIKGNENLKEGENIITITVFSKDNLKSKVYTINVLITDEPDKYNTLLSTLIVDNYPFNEEFFPEKFNYTLKNEIKDDTLEIFAYPQNQNAKVEITGNENLIVNNDATINITVTSENGLATRTYTIEPNVITSPSIENIKNINQDTNINNTITQNDENNSEFKTFLITSVIIIIILVLIIFIYKKKFS